MSFSRRNLIFRPRASIHSAVAAVIADPIHGVVIVDYGCVVNISNVRDINIVY